MELEHSTLTNENLPQFCLIDILNRDPRIDREFGSNTRSLPNDHILRFHS